MVDILAAEIQYKSMDGVVFYHKAVYKLTSAIAIRKSRACLYTGEKASKKMCPSGACKVLHNTIPEDTGLAMSYHPYRT